MSLPLDWHDRSDVTTSHNFGSQLNPMLAHCLPHVKLTCIIVSNPYFFLIAYHRLEIDWDQRLRSLSSDPSLKSDSKCARTPQISLMHDLTLTYICPCAAPTVRYLYCYFFSISLVVGGFSVWGSNLIICYLSYIFWLMILGLGFLSHSWIYDDRYFLPWGGSLTSICLYWRRTMSAQWCKVSICQLSHSHINMWASGPLFTGSAIMSTLHSSPSECLQVGAFSQPSELQEVCLTLISSLYSLLIHYTGTWQASVRKPNTAEDSQGPGVEDCILKSRFDHA